MNNITTEYKRHPQITLLNGNFLELIDGIQMDFIEDSADATVPESVHGFIGYGGTVSINQVQLPDLLFQRHHFQQSKNSCLDRRGFRR